MLDCNKRGGRGFPYNSVLFPELSILCWESEWIYLLTLSILFARSKGERKKVCSFACPRKRALQRLSIEISRSRKGRLNLSHLFNLLCVSQLASTNSPSYFMWRCGSAPFFAGGRAKRTRRCRGSIFGLRQCDNLGHRLVFKGFRLRYGTLAFCAPLRRGGVGRGEWALAGGGWGLRGRDTHGACIRHVGVLILCWRADAFVCVRERPRQAQTSIHTYSSRLFDNQSTPLWSRPCGVLGPYKLGCKTQRGRLIKEGTAKADAKLETLIKFMMMTMMSFPQADFLDGHCVLVNQDWITNDALWRYWPTI